MGTRWHFLVVFLLSLLLVSLCSTVVSSVDEDLEEELRGILEQDDEFDHSFPRPPQYPEPDHLDGEGEDEDDEDSDDFDYSDRFDGGAEAGDRESYSMPKVDERDVVVLKERNFTTVIENNQYVMVEFYAPWCGHCQSLAPDYAAAATELRDEEVVLAKVDATVEFELAREYQVQGFPTLLFFVDGVHRPYPAQRTKEAIVTWIKKKIGPGLSNITTMEDAERILTSHSKLVLGFLNSLAGPESDELAAASKLEDDVNFYQTENLDVAKLFHIDPEAKRPALVLLKKEVEKLSHFDGIFSKSSIAEFVLGNKLPLVTTFTKESAPMIFDSIIKKQLLLFATSKDKKKFVPTFQEAAKFFKGKLIFVYVEMDNKDVGKPVSDYFGIAGYAPKVLAYTGNEDAKKFVFDGDLNLENIKAFGENFLEDKLKPFFKSDPIPDNNDGDVKIVVGNNFEEIVLDETKDVLLEIYAPWCGHCQSLEPIYTKLAKHLRGVESLVIAKMDGSTNEHPRAKAEGFPTILFFPAGNKSSDPTKVETDRTVVAFYKFLKEHASIPFKLPRPDSAPESDRSETKDGPESTSKAKDEL